MNMHVYIYKKLKHCLFFCLFVCLFLLLFFCCCFVFVLFFFWGGGGGGGGGADEVTRYLKYHPVSKSYKCESSPYK